MIETVVIVVIVVCFFAMTTGLRAFASKRATGRWRYPGMLKYRPDRWEDHSTPWWSRDVTVSFGGHSTDRSDSVDSGGHDDGSSGGRAGGN